MKPRAVVMSPRHTSGPVSTGSAGFTGVAGGAGAATAAAGAGLAVGLAFLSAALAARASASPAIPTTYRKVFAADFTSESPSGLQGPNDSRREMGEERRETQARNRSES